MSCSFTGMFLSESLINHHENGIAICQFVSGNFNQFRTIKQEKKELEKEGKYKTGCGVGSVYISGKAIHDYANLRFAFDLYYGYNFMVSDVDIDEYCLARHFYQRFAIAL